MKKILRGRLSGSDSYPQKPAALSKHIFGDPAGDIRPQKTALWSPRLAGIGLGRRAAPMILSLIWARSIGTRWTAQGHTRHGPELASRKDWKFRHAWPWSARISLVPSSQSRDVLAAFRQQLPRPPGSAPLLNAFCQSEDKILGVLASQRPGQPRGLSWATGFSSATRRFGTMLWASTRDRPGLALEGRRGYFGYFRFFLIFPQAGGARFRRTRRTSHRAPRWLFLSCGHPYFNIAHSIRRRPLTRRGLWSSKH